MKKFKVDFINSGYRRFFKQHRRQIMSAVERCYAKGDFVLRQDVAKFELSFAKFLGAKYAVGVNSGTDALKVAYKALGCKPGDEVITVSNTFIAPIQEIVHLGAKPILIDVGPDGLMDVEKIEQEITPKTVGIVPVQLSGKICNMNRIMDIARKHNLWVVEDACQALGAVYMDEGRYCGKKAGTIGDIGCFSFIAPKTLGIGGDAGGCVTNRKNMFMLLRLLRNHWNITQGVLHGYQPKAPAMMGWGYNTRLDNIHAAVLNVKLKYYPKLLARRKEIGMKYNKGLSGLPIQLPIQQPGQIYQEYIIRVPNMYKFKRFMDRKGVELLIRDTTPNHKLPGLGLQHLTLPVTESMATEAVRLPIYPELKDSEVGYIIRCIKSFFK